MNIKKTLFTTSALLTLGLFSFACLKNVSQERVKVAAEEIEDIVTVDPNKCWGDGEENYKVAAYFTDQDSHEAWSDLVSIEAIIKEEEQDLCIESLYKAFIPLIFFIKLLIYSPK